MLLKYRCAVCFTFGFDETLYGYIEHTLQFVSQSLWKSIGQTVASVQVRCNSGMGKIQGCIMSEKRLNLFNISNLCIKSSDYWGDMVVHLQRSINDYTKISSRDRGLNCRYSKADVEHVNFRQCWEKVMMMSLVLSLFICSLVDEMEIYLFMIFWHRSILKALIAFNSTLLN